MCWVVCTALALQSHRIHFLSQAIVTMVFKQRRSSILKHIVYALSRQTSTIRSQSKLLFYVQKGLCKDYWFVVTVCTLMLSLPCKSSTFESTFGMCSAMDKVAPLGLLSQIYSISLRMSGEDRCTHICWLLLKLLCLSLYHLYDAWFYGSREMYCFVPLMQKSWVGWGVTALIALSPGFTADRLYKNM